MCLIVDSCVASQVFCENSATFRPVLEAIKNGSACVVYGGHLTDEYCRMSNVWRLVIALDRAGRAKQMPRSVVDEETRRLEKSGLCRSNDCHVIAVARVGKARLLCSKDEGLHEDFKNKDLIDDPRGKIYQNETHAHLLREICSGSRT